MSLIRIVIRALNCMVEGAVMEQQKNNYSIEIDTKINNGKRRKK